ncbi:MAG: ribosome biogenesis GTP-binding protein YihA/YsxC [Hyphomicrobiaceae bacterium]
MTREPDAQSLAAGEALFARPWRFLKSVPSLEFLPEANRPEVAFAGRSNVGKSSLINAVLRHGGMARTSNTPGRTQELNFFLTDDIDLYLVDMPGYGFAKAPKEKVEAWTALVRDYLRGRPTLVRVLLLVDSRHGLKANDHDVMRILDEAAVIYQVVLTKSDKISEKAAAHVLAAVEKALAAHPAAYPEVLMTSSAKGPGIAELRAIIAGLIADRR